MKKIFLLFFTLTITKASFFNEWRGKSNLNASQDLNLCQCACLHKNLGRASKNSYLVLGGYIPDDYSRHTEVVDLDSNPNMDLSFGLLPQRRKYAVGGMFGNIPIICGGR